MITPPLVVAALILVLGECRRNQNCRCNDCGEGVLHWGTFHASAVIGSPFSPTLKWLIAIFLPLTLAWKLTIKADDNDHVEEEVTSFLSWHGFQAAKDTNSRLIFAVKGSCRVRMMIAFNDGADRDMMRSLVGADESLIFVHHGKVYQEQPILLTVSAELWVRVLRKLGLTDRREFVLAVVAQRQCDADGLPWDQLK